MVINYWYQKLINIDFVTNLWYNIFSIILNKCSCRLALYIQNSETIVVHFERKIFLKKFVSWSFVVVVFLSILFCCFAKAAEDEKPEYRISEEEFNSTYEHLERKFSILEMRFLKAACEDAIEKPFHIEIEEDYICIIGATAAYYCKDSENNFYRFEIVTHDGRDIERYLFEKRQLDWVIDCGYDGGRDKIDIKFVDNI